ncbi:hypothetical protein BWR15_25350 [Pseudomonas sp. T]|nr:hypothetical protein BWR15_25350 [Pseudomonas sp. T]
MGQVALEPGLIVVARGAVSLVQECLPDLKVRVLVRSSKQSVVVDIEEIEILPPRTDNNAVIHDCISRVDDASHEDMESAERLSGLILRYMSGELSAANAAQEAGVALATFYRKLKQYDQQIGAASLLRITRGRKCGEKYIDPKIETLIEDAIKSNYKGKSATISSVWRAVEFLCIGLGLKVPSRTAVAARIKAMPERERCLLLQGYEATSQKFDPKPGRKDVTRPLEWVQMDHTLVDVILVDSETRLPIGRPWLTVLIDLRTRVILGYYLSMYAPSLLSVASAMAHAALPKNSFLKRLGLNPNLHPFYGVPETLHLDNAKEFRTVKLMKACSTCGISIEWRPRGKKHYGGHVERLIGTMMTQYVHFLPGTTHSNTQRRKGYDSEKNAALSFSEFSKWFAGQVAIYHARKHSQLKASPAAEWRRLFTSPSGELQHPPLAANPWEFKLNFMPEETRTIHPQGITINNVWYWSNGLKPYIGQRNVTIKFDPHSMATIWAKLDGAYIPISFSNVTRSDYSYEENRASSRAALVLGVVPDGALEDQQIASVIKEAEKVVTVAVKETKKQRRQRAAMQAHDASAWSDGEVKTPRKEQDSSLQAEKPDYTKRAEPYSRRTQ